MLSHQWTKRLQLLQLPLRNLNIHLGCLMFMESLNITKSFSSSNNKNTIAGQEEKQLTFTVSYLINSCGLSLESAKSLSKQVKFENPKRPDSVIKVLRDHGFTNAQISKLIKMRPKLLLADKKKTLLPKFEFLQSLGISGAALADMVCSCRTILRLSLKNRIIPDYNFLKNLLKDDKKVAHVLKRVACLNDFHNVAASSISLLQRLGLPNGSILRLLLLEASVLCLRAEKLDEYVKMISGMGFDPLENKFIVALGVVSTLSGESWERKLKAFKEPGLSKDEILLAFRRFPIFMALSEENISGKMEFLVNKMSWDSAAVVRVPCVLGYSMEKRIIPRCSVIQALLFQGLIKEKPRLSSFLVCTDKFFVERFVNRYQEQEARLFDIFKGKIKPADLGIEFEGLYELKSL